MDAKFLFTRPEVGTGSGMHGSVRDDSLCRVILRSIVLYARKHHPLQIVIIQVSNYCMQGQRTSPIQRDKPV
jgi:hypothetical protein